MPKALTFSLAAAGLLQAGLFFLPAYHGFYWSHPLVFAPLTAMGAAAALGGGCLAGQALRGPRAPGRRARWTLRGLGSALAIPAAALGAAALLLALDIAKSTGYWGAAPAGYGGDYLVMLLQIRLSQAAALPGVAGGLLLGLSWPRQSE